jgi:prepilin-type N-terminal cleavage/methylation domain-containing protein
MDDGTLTRYDIPMRNAFSLVELSIVLVILGLLTGGILTGQSLIRASELRAVGTEYQRYVAATNTFRDKYFALPGDMRNATAFWGRLNGNADCVTNSGAAVATPGTCDGNGGGTIDFASAAGASGEMFQFWRQLALAGMIEGTYSGLAGAAAAGDHVLGTNAPRSRMANTGWGVWPLGNYAGDGATYAYDYGNMFGFGVQVATAWPLTAALKPEEAWNIDTKLDDGRPGAGRILPRDNAGFAGAAADKCTTSANNTDYAGSYNLSNSNVACPLHFARAF